MEEAKAWLRSYAIQLYEREEGQAADWPVIAQGMFAAAFSIIDEAKGDARARSVLRRVEASVYDRLAGNEGGDLPPTLGTGPVATPDPIRAPRLPEPRLKP